MLSFCQSSSSFYKFHQFSTGEKSMTEPKPIIRMQDISKSFGGVRALKNVGMEVFSGEVHAILGENGAGKSTLIKTMTGVHQPDSGDIYLSWRVSTLQWATRCSADGYWRHLSGTEPLP
jgi:ABC-type sugar transport system ATPase subunit